MYHKCTHMNIYSIMVLWLLLLLCDTQKANVLVNVLTFHHDLWLFV
jgi:hypothetical protein